MQPEKLINLTIDKKALVDLELNKADESVRQLEVMIREKRKILLARARALSYLKHFKWSGLLAADSPTTFERNLKILSKLSQYDLGLFKDYKAAIRNLAQGRNELIGYKKELESILIDLNIQEQDLQRKDAARGQTLAAENKKSLLLFKGKMPTPTEGQIIWNFGAHRDDQNQYAFMTRGLLYRVQANEKIHAVGPGKVIFRDPIPYWGETLIIQHDDNYYSVYAGVQASTELLAEVKMNEVVAQSLGSEFYFELRHFDNPINPKLWLKEKL